MWDILADVFGYFPKNIKTQPESAVNRNPQSHANNSRLQGEVPEFSELADPFQIHSFIEGQFDGMLKGLFGELTSHFNFNFNELTDVDQSGDPPDRKLRDCLLKPNIVEKERQEDRDFDGRVNSSDIEAFFDQPLKRRDKQISLQSMQPHFYFKSVSVQTIRKPDGTIETVRTVRDHTGRDETIVTRQDATSPYPPPAGGPDLRGDSLFSKFFT